MRPESPYRQLLELIDVRNLAEVINLKNRPIFKEKPFGYREALRTVILAFWKDLSPGQLQVALEDRLEMRWFSGYNLTSRLPIREYFSELYRQIGTKALSRLFESCIKRCCEPLYRQLKKFTNAGKVEKP